MSTWKQFADAKGSFERLQKLLDQHPERAHTRIDKEFKGQVRVESLSASAQGRTKPILKGLNVAFKAGEVVAIVGPSGAGKSTLVRCIMGIWPETKGKVLLDNKEIESYSRDDLGPHIGYLPQDIELFDGSIAENIGRFGQIDSQLVINAAIKTGIHDMILRFPKGYDTPMGEAGSMLSGGQRQRVGLARAIYGDPELIVLDEPNANLDDVGEAALIRCVEDLRTKGCTVLMVVHQRNLLSVADRVLVMQDGTVSQFGTLAELSAAAPKATVAQTRTTS